MYGCKREFYYFDAIRQLHCQYNRIKAFSENWETILPCFKIMPNNNTPKLVKVKQNFIFAILLLFNISFKKFQLENLLTTPPEFLKYYIVRILIIHLVRSVSFSIFFTAHQHFVWFYPTVTWTVSRVLFVSFLLSLNVLFVYWCRTPAGVLFFSPLLQLDNINCLMGLSKFHN